MRTPVLLVVFVAMVAQAQPMAGIYPVGPGGPGVDSFATIQAAASALSARGLAGDVEFPIRQSVYFGPVTLRSVTGSDRFRIRFRPVGIGAIVDASGAQHCIAVESTDNVTIQGLRFRGCRDSGSAFVRFTASDHGTLRSCRLEDSAQFGVQAVRSDSFVAESLRYEGDLLGSDSRGLDLQDCRFALATRCTMEGRVGNGLWVQGGSDNGCYRVSVTNVTGHGLHIENSPRAAIHNFRAAGSSQYAGYVVNSRQARLDSCVFRGGNRAAVRFESCESLWFDMGMAIGDAERAVAVINSPHSRVMTLSVMGSPARGLLIQGSPMCHVESTQYAGFAADTCIGIEVDSSDGCMFMYTQAAGRVARGISIRRSGQAKFRHTRLTLTAAEAGIYLERADGVRFELCSLNLAEAQAAVLLADSSTADSFLRMTIVGNHGTGVLARETRELVVANSFLRGWTEDGIRLEGGRTADIYYNTISGPADGPGSTLHLRDAADVQARDNILVNRGPDSSACWSIVGTWPLRIGGSDHNDLYVAGAGSTARVNDTLYRTLPDWQGLPGTPDPASIAADPLFVSLSDYHITVNSPCRDAGTPVAGFEYDIEGDERDRNSPDIGADEFTSPGAAEHAAPGTARRSPGCKIVRGTLEMKEVTPAALLDIDGRRVLDLRPGLNNISRIAAGVYFIRFVIPDHGETRRLIVE